jgi:hypothetical protein
VIAKMTMSVRIMILLLLVTVVYAGGWDLVTVMDFPDLAVADKPLKLAFRVWVPSLEPMRGLHPVVRATPSKGRPIRVSAKAGTVAGEYTAILTLPEPGEWVIAFDTEYENAATLPPLKVIAAGAPAPSPLSLAVRGRRLFTSKGCNGCHLHPEVNDGRDYGPDLTGRRFGIEYLRRFLADPSITRAPEEVCNKERSRCGSPYDMPNLNLKTAEIEALVAFLTGRDSAAPDARPRSR